MANGYLTDIRFPQIKIPKQSLNAHKTVAHKPATRKTTRKTVRRV